MIVIGIDPAMTGFHAVAALVTEDREKYAHTFSYLVPVDKRVPVLRSQILAQIFRNADEMIRVVRTLWDNPDDDRSIYIFCEEPPLAGARNVRTALLLAQNTGAIVAGITRHTELAYLTPVSTWKKATCGAGNASKEQVTAWLNAMHPDYSALCDGSQDLVDASCISLYALGVVTDAQLVRAIGSSGDL